MKRHHVEKLAHGGCSGVFLQEPFIITICLLIWIHFLLNSFFLKCAVVKDIVSRQLKSAEADGENYACVEGTVCQKWTASRKGTHLRGYHGFVILFPGFSTLFCNPATEKVHQGSQIALEA